MVMVFMFPIVLYMVKMVWVADLLKLDWWVSDFWYAKQLSIFYVENCLFGRLDRMALDWWSMVIEDCQLVGFLGSAFLGFHWGYSEYSEHDFEEPGEYLTDVPDEEAHDLEKFVVFDQIY